MPVIGISVKRLNQLLQQEMPHEKLAETLERLGCDVEGIAQQCVYSCPACSMPLEKLSHEEAPKRCGLCGYESTEPFVVAAQDQVIRLDLLPARPDLFDAGGLARAIKGYLGLEVGLPRYSTQPGSLEVTVDPALSQKESYRPYLACAEVQMPPLDGETLREIMRLQESLHWGIGRDRKLASIGVYEAMNLQSPIAYRPVGPEELSFVPLGMPGKRMTPREILQTHPKGIAYAHLLAQHQRYPMLIDSAGQVLSMPPIINSHETRLKPGSDHFFLDVTGITASDVQRSLNTLVTSLMELGATVRQVRIKTTGEESWTPDLSPRKIKVNIETARRWLGLPLEPRDFLNYLDRMRLSASGRAPHYSVNYPAFRTDIKHEVDIIEDIGIAHGYHQLPLKMVSTMTVAEERPEEKLSHLVRQTMLGLGFVEIMSLMQTTQENHFTRLGLTPGHEHAQIKNPKSADYNIVRHHLFSGLLETLERNRRKPAPQRYFELGNVVLIDDQGETGVREERHLGLALLGPQTGYAEGRSMLDAVLYEIGLAGTYQPYERPFFIPGRCAQISLPKGLLAILGEVHPKVLNQFNVPYPVVLAELPLMRIEFS